MHICLDWLFLKYFSNFPWLQNTFSFVDRTLKHVPRLKMSMIWSYDVVADTNRKMTWISIQGTNKKWKFLMAFTRKQRPARFSFLENSREFFFIFTSLFRSWAVSISLSLLEKEWRDFIFHFSILEKKWKLSVFHSFFSRKKSEIRCGL